jgi:hypothetical protein
MAVRSRRRTSALGRHLPDALTGKSRPLADVHDRRLSGGPIERQRHRDPTGCKLPENPKYPIVKIPVKIPI